MATATSRMVSRSKINVVRMEIVGMIGRRAVVAVEIS